MTRSAHHSFLFSLQLMERVISADPVFRSLRLWLAQRTVPGQASKIRER
jgi:hypothetical protein